MSPNACGPECGSDCHKCNGDKFGWQGINENKKGYADTKIPDPLAGGQAFSRQRPQGNQPVNINFQPASSYGYNQQQNMGTSEGRQQSQSVSGTRVDPLKMGMYNQLLGMNMQNYQNQLGAYNTGQNELRGNLGGVYGQLPSIQNTLGMGQVLGKDGNWGVAQAGADAIASNQAKNKGLIEQQMATRGLSNTTATQNLQNQNVEQANRAYGALGADLAGRAAAYQQQGINTQMAGAGMQADAAWRAANALGHQFGNTFGNLDTSFSQGSSFGMNNSQNMGSSMGENWTRGAYEMPGYGNGGLGGGDPVIGAAGAAMQRPGGGLEAAPVGAGIQGGGMGGQMGPPTPGWTLPWNQNALGPAATLNQAAWPLF